MNALCAFHSHVALSTPNKPAHDAVMLLANATDDIPSVETARIDTKSL